MLNEQEINSIMETVLEGEPKKIYANPEYLPMVGFATRFIVLARKKRAPNGMFCKQIVGDVSFFLAYLVKLHIGHSSVTEDQRATAKTKIRNWLENPFFPSPSGLWEPLRLQMIWKNGKCQQHHTG